MQHVTEHQHSGASLVSCAFLHVRVQPVRLDAALFRNKIYNQYLHLEAVLNEAGLHISSVKYSYYYMHALLGVNYFYVPYISLQQESIVHNNSTIFPHSGRIACGHTQESHSMQHYTWLYRYTIILTAGTVGRASMLSLRIRTASSSDREAIKKRKYKGNGIELNLNCKSNMHHF